MGGMYHFGEDWPRVFVIGDHLCQIKKHLHLKYYSHLCHCTAEKAGEDQVGSRKLDYRLDPTPRTVSSEQFEEREGKHSPTHVHVLAVIW